MTLQTVLNVVLGLSTLLLCLVLWSVKRHRDPVLTVERKDPLAELVPSIAGLTHGAVVAGNSVDILENGAFFDAMFEDIRKARASVHFETFLWKEGILGRRLVDALVERRRAGVEVRVLVDADGGKEMGEEAQRRLREADMQVRVVPSQAAARHRQGQPPRPPQAAGPGRAHRLCRRALHRRPLARRRPQDSGEVRDVGIRVQGPVVNDLQSTFSENWVDETGELFVGTHVFPEIEEAGKVAVHVARVKPEGAPPAVKILHHLVLGLAQKRLWIQNPYFLPDREAIEAMAQAVRRGVDVRIMVPSAEASDFPAVQHAAHRNFETLLAAGVRILEYPKTLLHQKMLTIDGVWSAIGSSNFDDRSFEINDEITLGLLDEGVARRFEAIFEKDALECVELRHETWRERGMWHKLKDNALYLFNEQL